MLPMLLIDTDTVVDRSLVVIGHPPQSISRPPTQIWSLSAPFVSLIYWQSPALVYGHTSCHCLCCFQLQSSKLFGFHSLLEIEDGAEVGHDSVANDEHLPQLFWLLLSNDDYDDEKMKTIADDENLPSATNPKRCTGQCRGSVVCRYTNPATQSCNRIIFLNIYQLQGFKEGLGE